MKGPVEPVHRSVPESIQEVIELTGFHCFLFRSTPNLNSDNHFYLTINCGTGQHSQFLRRFNEQVFFWQHTWSPISEHGLFGTQSKTLVWEGS